MKIDHIGYFTSNINKSIQEFEKMGFKKVSDIILDDIPLESTGKARGINICFISNDGYRIELVEPVSDDSIVANMAKNGAGPYHICYKSNDIIKEIESLKKDKWIIVQKPDEAIAYNGAKVAFLYKNNVGLIELVEER